MSNISVNPESWQESQFLDQNQSSIQGITTADPRNILDICRQLAFRDSRRPDKAVSFARDVIKALFYNKHIDLCSILPSPGYDSPYVAVLELIDAFSHFFNVFFEGNEKLADELWQAIYDQIQSNHAVTQSTDESVLMYCLSRYIMRLLPTEITSDKPVQRNTIRQRVHTPLDLFLPSSPVLNRIRFESEGKEPDRAAIHPRHIKMFCNMVVYFCSTAEFPSPSRLMVLRHLVKQFHVFCTFKTNDSDMMATKNAVLAEPPFAEALYNFLYTFLEQSPSATSLQELISVWLTFCRPWRYSLEEINDVRNSIFEPFIQNQDKFYRVLLGKIMKKLLELEITVETLRTIKCILECSWKEPMYTVTRTILWLDTRPSARKILDRLAAVRKTELVKVISYEAERNSEPWWKVIFNYGTEDPVVIASKLIINAIEPILKDADAHMHTHYLTEKIVYPNITRMDKKNRSEASAFEQRETPKRGYLPDHETDPSTGLMYATALGRKQIFENERSFDFSQCHSYVPSWQSAPREYEFAPMVHLMRFLAPYVSRLGPIEAMGMHYYDNSWKGKIARILMDPPCPNPYSTIASPVFTKKLRRTPPTLKIRIFANNLFLIALFFLVFYIYLGAWVIIPAIFFAIALLVIYLNNNPDFCV